MLMTTITGPIAKDYKLQDVFEVRSRSTHYRNFRTATYGSGYYATTGRTYEAPDGNRYKWAPTHMVWGPALRNGDNGPEVANCKLFTVKVQKNGVMIAIENGQGWIVDGLRDGFSITAGARF